MPQADGRYFIILMIPWLSGYEVVIAKRFLCPKFIIKTTCT